MTSSITIDWFSHIHPRTFSNELFISLFHHPLTTIRLQLKLISVFSYPPNIELFHLLLFHSIESFYYACVYSLPLQ